MKKESTEGTAVKITSNKNEPPCETKSIPSAAFLVAALNAEIKECPTATQVILINLIPFIQSRWSFPTDSVDNNLLPFEYME